MGWGKSFLVLLLLVPATGLAGTGQPDARRGRRPPARRTPTCLPRRFGDTPVQRAFLA